MPDRMATSVNRKSKSYSPWFGLSSCRKASSANLNERFTHPVSRRLPNGQLSAVQTRMLLEGGEICHWDRTARIHGKTSRAVKVADGTLCITSNRVIFSSATKNFSFKPSRIMDINLKTDGIALCVNGNRGTGWYFLGDAELVESILFGLAQAQVPHGR